MGHMCATTAAGRGRRTSSRRERRLEAQAAAGARPRCETGGRGSSPGSAPSTAPSASTTTSSTRAASARIFATVAPSTGLAGSTSWVTKTSLTAPPTRSTSSRRARRTPPGSPASASAARRAPAPSRSASARSDEHRTSASASAPRVPGGDEDAVLAVARRCRGCRRRARRRPARPRQNASTTIRGSPSERDGSTSAVASSIARRDLRRRRATASSGRGPGTRRRDARRRPLIVPRPTRRSCADGHTRRGEPPGLRQHLDRLVALEHADEERRRLRRQRRAAGARGTSRGP